MKGVIYIFFGLNDSDDKPNQASENKLTLSKTLGHLHLPKIHGIFSDGLIKI